jgi:acyl-coenzyme A thioesterase PaaI-like protein
MNTHFLAAVTPGDFVELRGEVTRATRGLVFVRGILAVGETDVAAIDGIWRVLRASPTG